jgi:hypothetical protein
MFDYDNYVETLMESGFTMNEAIEAADRHIQDLKESGNG